ncbi:hypothetical protein, partial [Holzapfeliella sp. JNUCC72]
MPQVQVFADENTNSNQKQVQTNNTQEQPQSKKESGSDQTQQESTNEKGESTNEQTLTLNPNTVKNNTAQSLGESKAQTVDKTNMSKTEADAQQDALFDLQNAPTRNPMKTQDSLINNGYSSVYAQAYQDFYNGYSDGEQDATANNKTNAQQGFATQYPASYSPSQKAGYDAAKNDYKMTTEKNRGYKFALADVMNTNPAKRKLDSYSADFRSAYNDTYDGFWLGYQNKNNPAGVSSNMFAGKSALFRLAYARGLQFNGGTEIDAQK